VLLGVPLACGRIAVDRAAVAWLELLGSVTARRRRRDSPPQGCAEHCVGSGGAKKGGIWQFVRTYLVSIGVLPLGFLLLISLLLSTALRERQVPLPAWSGVTHCWMDYLLRSDHAVICHDVQVAAGHVRRWRDVWLGAAITAALFEIGKLLMPLNFLHIGRGDGGTFRPSNISLTISWRRTVPRFI
jgi:hypothetical protein